MTCAACHHEWIVLPAHVVRTSTGCQAQCPACGAQQPLDNRVACK